MSNPINSLTNTQKIQKTLLKKSNKYENTQQQETIEHTKEIMSSKASYGSTVQGKLILSKTQTATQKTIAQKSTLIMGMTQKEQEEAKKLIENIKKNSSIDTYELLLSISSKNSSKHQALNLIKTLSLYIADKKNSISNMTEVINFLSHNTLFDELDPNSKTQYLFNLLIAASKNTPYKDTLLVNQSQTFNNDTIQTLINNISSIKDDNIKNIYLMYLAQAVSQTKNLSKDIILSLSQTFTNINKIEEEIIKILVKNIKNIAKNNKNEYLCFIVEAVNKTYNIKNDTIKTLLGNLTYINKDKKSEYLYFIAEAANKTYDLKDDTFKTLLGNLTYLNEDKKSEYLDNITKAASQTKNLSKKTILLLSQTAAKSYGLKNDTINILINFFKQTKFTKKKKEKLLIDIIQAAVNTDKINYSTKYSLIDIAKKNNINTPELIRLTKKDIKTKIQTEKSFCDYVDYKAKYKDEDINEFIDILNNNSMCEMEHYNCLLKISKVLCQTNDLKEETIKKLLNQKDLSKTNFPINTYLNYIANAINKMPNSENIKEFILEKHISNIKRTTKKTGQENKLKYISILSCNLTTNNKKIIISLFNKALNYGMFENVTDKPIQRSFIRNLIDVISRFEKNEAEELYNTLYSIAIKSQDNTETDNEYNETIFIDKPKHKTLPHILNLFFAKLGKRLGKENDEIQKYIYDIIKDKNEQNTLSPEISLHPALNYLTNDNLKAIKENDVINRTISTNFQKDIQQFELEYLIDLKLSRKLYDLENQEEQNNLINILTTNYDILTNTFNCKMEPAEQTNQLAGDVIGSADEIDTNVNMDNISSKTYDGVYNLALIILKQIKPENRDEFLNNLIKSLEKKNKKNKLDNKKVKQTIKFLNQLKTNGKFDNEKLLKTKPVLRQYREKNQTVSKNYQPNLTSFRIPRTTDKCEVWQEEDETRYLGFKGTSQKIKTELNEQTAQLLFGSESSSSHQIIGNCWLIATIKEIEADPQLKLFIYSHFNAEVENGQLEYVSITLKDGKKVTFSKEVVDEVSKIGATEQLAPAMSCLALLSAIYRTTKNDKGLNDIEKIPEEINLQRLKEIFGENNSILNALRISNETGDGYYDLLTLFINKNKQNKNLKRKIFCLEGHQIGSYGDFQLNPQNSYSLFIFNKAKKVSKQNYLNKIIFPGVYYIPKINKNHEYYETKTGAIPSFFSRTKDYISRIFLRHNDMHRRLNTIRQ